MWLVLCDGDDDEASWARDELRRRGVVPVELITTRELVEARRWVHRTGRDVFAAVTLADGREFSSAHVRGVLNRVARVPLDRFVALRDGDRVYAEQEFVALLMSWLNCFRNTFNPPAPGGLCGQWRGPAEWRVLAAQAGLPSTALHRAARDASTADAQPQEQQIERVLVVDGEAVGSPDTAHLHAACRGLATLAQTPLLEVDFACSSDGTQVRLLDASPLPALRWAGDAGIDALVRALTHQTSAPSTP